MSKANTLMASIFKCFEALYSGKDVQRILFARERGSFVIEIKKVERGEDCYREAAVKSGEISAIYHAPTSESIN